MISSQEGIWESEYYTPGENKNSNWFLFRGPNTESQNKGK